ncbi:MAG: serine/threonine-protein phosphatase [Calditrichae bacterium]|nr:serine/threonine-protein phosphatase [Calditrichia bacterium]
MNNSYYYRREFWKNLSGKSLIKLGLAIFFTFSSIGFISDLLSGGRYLDWYVVFNVIFSGLIGVGYALGAIRNWKWIPIVLGTHLAVAIILPSTTIVIENIVIEISKVRLIVDSAGILAMVMLGYIFFIIFITGEGIPQVQLKTEIDLARKMHDVLVPEIEIRDRRFHIFGKSQPYLEVGGDLIDVYQKDDILVCYTADVSGHGVAASLLMGMFKSAVYTALSKSLSLQDLVNTCNQVLNQLKKPTMFLTFSAIRFDGTNLVEFSVAGHLPILHYRADENKIEELIIKQIPVSVKKDYNFLTRKAQFNRGDIFLFLSDGLTETNDKNGIEFGMENIKKILLENARLPLSEIYNVVTGTIEKYGTQKDDQSLMIVKNIV